MRSHRWQCVMAGVINLFVSFSERHSISWGVRCARCMVNITVVEWGWRGDDIEGVWSSVLPSDDPHPHRSYCTMLFFQFTTVYRDHVFLYEKSLISWQGDEGWVRLKSRNTDLCATVCEFWRKYRRSGGSDVVLYYQYDLHNIRVRYRSLQVQWSNSRVLKTRRMR